MELYEILRPMTSAPFCRSETYMEWEPCRELKPYIRCFWGSARPYRLDKTEIPSVEIVTPDICMDIIFTVDFKENRITGKFCGIDSRTFRTEEICREEKYLSVFAIRFYAWSAILFSEEPMTGTKNAFFDAGQYFSGIKKELEPLLFHITDAEERIRLTERYLLKSIRVSRADSLLTDAVGAVLKGKGSLEIGRLAREIHISTRQLERIFGENLGISPKQFSSLVRYQYVWNDVLYCPRFDILDAVYRYGYTDQSHLLRDFKRFHSMNISQARDYALTHVGFLQENGEGSLL